MPICFILILTPFCLFQVLENEIFKFEEQICDFEVTFVHIIFEKNLFLLKVPQYSICARAGVIFCEHSCDCALGILLSILCRYLVRCII
jgi:hypothetical protein